MRTPYYSSFDRAKSICQATTNPTTGNPYIIACFSSCHVVPRRNSDDQPNYLFIDTPAEYVMAIDLNDLNVYLFRNTDQNHKINNPSLFNSIFDSINIDKILNRSLSEKNRIGLIYNLSLPTEVVNYHEWNGIEPFQTTYTIRRVDAPNSIEPFQSEPPLWEVATVDNETLERRVLYRAHTVRSEVLRVNNFISQLLISVRDAFSGVDLDDLSPSARLEHVTADEDVARISKIIDQNQTDDLFELAKLHAAQKAEAKRDSDAARVRSRARLKRLRKFFIYWPALAIVAIFISGYISYRSSISYSLSINDGGKASLWDSAFLCIIPSVGHEIVSYFNDSHDRRGQFRVVSEDIQKIDIEPDPSFGIHPYGPWLDLPRGTVVSGPYTNQNGSNIRGGLNFGTGWQVVFLTSGYSYNYTKPFFTNRISEDNTVPLLKPDCI